MIDIKDISGNIRFSTPINQGSKRRHTLMKEDYVSLRFSVENPIYFKLGDYIDNEIGLFELVDLQKPTYNETNGGYDYELRLDAYYWKWKNKKFFYSPEAGGSEAGWNLTATLDIHLNVFLRNLSQLRYTYKGVGFSYSIDSTVEKSPKMIVYENMNLIDALTKMAEAWGCEWWIIGSVIYFGRCEHGETVDFDSTTNVLSMSRSDSKTNYATRVYAFGGTKNIPLSYRKPLVFDATVDGLFVHDEKRKLEGAYFPASSKITPTATTVDQTQVYSVSNGKLTLKNSAPADLPAGSYAIDFTELSIKMASRYRPGNDYIPVNVNIDVVIEVTYKGSTIVGARRTIVKSLKNVNIVAAGNGWTYLDTKETFDITTNDLSGGTTLCLDIYNLDGTPYMNRIDVSCEGKSSIWVERIRYNTSIEILSGLSKGTKYTCLYYPEILGKKNVIQLPKGSTVSTGDTYTIENIIRSKVPASHFSKPNTEQTVEGVVTTRLMLPEGISYVDAYESMKQEEAIEEIVTFEDVFPRRVGIMSSVHVVKKPLDDSNEVLDVYQFSDSDEKFIFSRDYVLSGQELRIKFQSGALNGLDFAVTFNPNNAAPEEQLFEVVRNEDYGRPLPDVMAAPRGIERDNQGNVTYEGDKYVLYGFDPEFVLNAMIPNAEAELLKRAQEYVDKSKIDPSTYDCKMAPNFIYNNGEYKNFSIGNKVNLINKTYFDNGRQSRIIGYEYSLDLPYDHPTYTVGETVAYSRIAALEEKVESLTYKGQTYSGGPVSGGSSYFDAAQMWATLSGSGAEQINKSHLSEALAGYARTADIPSLSGYATESWVNDKGYVTTNRLNELIGGASSAFDTLKEIEDYINSHESVTAGLIASLGNKVDKVTGMGLSEHSFTTALREKLNSIAEGANKYSLPVAQAAVLGGVMIGSNISVNAQGVISVAAPYSHPTQQVITAGAARHFLTGLAVNQYGHVTSATSAALTKDDLLSVLKDKDGVIRLDAKLALTGSLINFANLGTVNIPSLYDGIPVDGKSIYWENGTLKSSSTGGGGLAKVIVKVGLAAYESVDGVVTLPAYPAMPDLSNYVTLNTSQVITGQKTFVSDQIFATGAYFGTNKKGTLHADGSITAEIFRKTGGTASQFLKADGSVDSNTYVTIYHDHSYVRTGDYRDRNPVGFSNQTFTPFFLSGSKIALSGYFDAMYLNTYSDVSGGRTNLIALSKVSGEMYRMMVDQGSAAWNGTLVKMLDSSNYSNYAMSLDTEQTVTGRKIYSANQYYNNNIGIVTIDGQGLIFSDGTRTITGDATRPHRIRSNDSNLEHWRNGVGRYDILDGYNWRSIVDGRYLPLTGGSLSGKLTISLTNHHPLTLSANGAGNKNYVEYTNGATVLGHLGVSGVNTPSFKDNANVEYRIWHSGNDGAGSGLDADTLDGWHLSELRNSNITSLGTIQSGTVLECKNTLVNLFNSKASHGIGTNVTIGTSFIDQWSSDTSTYYPSSVYSMIKIGGGYTDMQYGQFLLSSYNITKLGVVGRSSNSWSGIKWLAFTTDNVASATKLQTSRSIYGQPFDGTNNVSGKAFVDQRMGGVATVSLAIGDTDTGFDWLADGVYKIKSDGIDIAQVSQDSFHLYKKLVIESNEGNYREGIRIKASSSNWVTIALGAIGEAGTSENMWSIHRTYENNFAIARNDSSGVNGMFIGKNGNVGFGTVTPTCKMEIHGAIKAVNGVITTNTEVYAGDAIYSGGRIFTGYDAGVVGAISCSNWFRSNGATGWFNGTYNGGIYMADSDQVRVYNNKVLYNDGFRQWGIGGHHCGIKLYNQDHIGINLATASYTWGIYANTDGNIYIGRRDGDINNTTGSYYLIIGAGTMTYNGSIVLNGGGLITYSSDIRLKEIQEYFKPSLSELAALPIFAHSWRNGTPGVQLSTSAQAVQKIMPWNVFEGSDGYLKMDGTRTALAVSIRLAQLANEYITENERWKSDKDRQIEALQREVRELKQQLNVT